MKFGSTEIIVIVVLAILVFGGSRIAGLGKSLGTSIRDFKKEMREDKAETEASKKDAVQKEEKTEEEGK